MAQWDKIGSRGNVQDRRGMGSAVGGIGITGIVLVLAVAYFGGGEQAAQVMDVIQETQSQSVQSGEQSAEFAGDDAYEVFASTVLGSNNDLWMQEFRAAGLAYEPPTLVLFRGATQSGCGGASSAIGPHYCPLDKTIYLDETFFDELQKRFGARGGDVAEAYVIAHEVGHHVQNILGRSGEVRRAQQRRPANANALSVQQELQADCYAGVWAHAIDDQGVFDPGEIEEAIDAAEAVGDDRIQEKTQGRVNPESWTHGSSADRKKWFNIGFESGDSDRCETFG